MDPQRQDMWALGVAVSVVVGGGVLLLRSCRRSRAARALARQRLTARFRAM